MGRNHSTQASFWLCLLCTTFVGCRKSTETLNAELLTAVRAWETGNARAALKAGADVNTMVPEETNSNPSTPDDKTPILVYAINRGNIECALLLLEHGADVNACSSNGATAVTTAIGSKGKMTPLLVELLKKEPRMNFEINACSGSGNPNPLFNAAAFSDVEIVNEFIRRGALINARDRDGSTALHLAARFNNVPVINALLTQGADVRIKNNKGQTAGDIVRIQAPLVDLQRAMKIPPMRR